MKRGGQVAQIILAAGFGLFVVISLLGDFEPGRQMGRTFATTALAMLGLLPCAFVLIGLFDVWVKQRTIERHFGRGAGIRGYVWIMLLAGMTVGGLYIAFPMAYSLSRKGARLGIVFSYVGFAGVCRIPMILFEASFMGWRFTAVRLVLSIPLVVLSSELLAAVLEPRGYKVTEP
jgi:uncharacterized membrane protein YraQ (UPF0718 family)